jgi:uncharacterized protein (TIGR02246 family)
LTPDEEAVRAANQHFYRAFESLDLDSMDTAWWHDGLVTCVHPGWPLASGWAAVRRGWESIFENTHQIRFEVADVQIELRGDFAWVVCIENLLSRSRYGESRGAVVATNVFRRERGAWRMVHHHASPFVQGEAEVEDDDDTPTGVVN